MATAGVYLIHFDTPYEHARHYLGWSTDIESRLEKHAAGTGARLMEVVRDNGISWRLARVWAGATRTRERQLKVQGGHSRKCPVCSQQRRSQRAQLPLPLDMAARA